MKRRVIYDEGEPVVIREYGWEGSAMLDRDLLAANGIPSMIRKDNAGEITKAVQLLVRREHSVEAIEILDAAPRDVDGGDEPHPDS